MKDRKVVITGGARFICSNFAKELAADNSVIIIDNLSVGKKENVTDLLGENVKFVKGSIGDLSLLKKLFRNVDFVFHQAAISSVPKSIENPLATNETNVTGTLNVLLTARDNSIKNVIFPHLQQPTGISRRSPRRKR